jgi:lipoprotein-releasing system permease protein
MFSYFTGSVALRHLVHGWGQSLLTIGVVSISMMVLIVLGAVMGGVEARQIGAVTGSQPQLTLERGERKPVAAWDLAADDDRVLYVGQTVDLPRSQKKLEDWREWMGFLETFDRDFLVVAPAAAGQVFLLRGARRENVRVIGVIPSRQNRITDFEGGLVAGRFLDLNSGEVAIGTTLAQNFGLRLGDKVRLVSAEQIVGSYTVAGIYETGFGSLDKDSAMLQLRDAQALLGLGNAISYMGIKLRDPFAAAAIKARLQPLVPLKVRAWTEDNRQIIDQLGNMRNVTSMVRVLTTLAGGFAIASILIMVVTSKNREIGILRAMGARPVEIRTIFLLEGLFLAAIGCIVGLTVATLLIDFMQSLTQIGPAGKLVPRFALDLSAELKITSTLIALTVGAIAAWIPARRAGRVDPMQVIRGT